MHSNNRKVAALQRAIDQYKSKQALAHALGVTHVHLYNWLKRGDCIPYHHAVTIAFETGIPLSHLAPYAPSANHLLDTVKAMHSNDRKVAALKRAIDQYKGKRVLAHALGVTPAHLNNWLKRGDYIPYHHAVTIAFETGIPLSQLAPQAPLANRLLDTIKATVLD